MWRWGTNSKPFFGYPSKGRHVSRWFKNSTKVIAFFENENQRRVQALARGDGPTPRVAEGGKLDRSPNRLNDAWKRARKVRVRFRTHSRDWGKPWSGCVRRSALSRVGVHCQDDGFPSFSGRFSSQGAPHNFLRLFHGIGDLSNLFFGEKIRNFFFFSTPTGWGGIFFFYFVFFFLAVFIFHSPPF